MGTKECGCTVCPVGLWEQLMAAGFVLIKRAPCPHPPSPVLQTILALCHLPAHLLHFMLHGHSVMDGYIESCGSYSVTLDGPSSRATDGSTSLAPKYTEWIRVRENIQVCVRGCCRTSLGLGWCCIFANCSHLLDINIPHTKYYGGVHATPPLASMYEDHCEMVNAAR